MTKLVSAVTAFGFLTNYMIVSVTFLLFIDWYDTGQWDFNGWQGMAIGGLLVGITTMMIEVWLYQRLGFWPQNRLLFVIRLLALNTVGLAASFTLGYAIGLALEVSGSNVLGIFLVLPLLVIVPLVTVFYFGLMIPFGIYLGLTNGLFLRFSRAFRWS